LPTTDQDISINRQQRVGLTALIVVAFGVASAVCVGRLTDDRSPADLRPLRDPAAVVAVRR
jgi:hypothetical protein